MLLGTIDGHGPICSLSRSTRSRSDSVSFKSCTLVGAGHGLDGGVGAELLRFSEGTWQIDWAVADVGMGNGSTLECRVGEGSSSDSEHFC